MIDRHHRRFRHERMRAKLDAITIIGGSTAHRPRAYVKRRMTLHFLGAVT